NVIDRHTLRARFELKARLLSNAFIGLSRPALGFPLQRKRNTCERSCRVDALFLKLVDLEFRYSGDQTKVIVIAPSSIALSAPSADLAVFLRVWVGAGFHPFGNHSLERCSDQTVICGVIICSEGLRLKFRPGRNDVHLFGNKTLRRGDKIGIQAKLQNGAALR